MSKDLYERAVAISERAYAPYSNYLVGAAVRTRDGKVFEGVNVENAAYPLGVCRQWLYEFRIDEITFLNSAGELVTYSAAELLPDTWDLSA